MEVIEETAATAVSPVEKNEATDPYIYAKAAAVVYAYEQHYLPWLSSIDVLSVETEFAFDLLNPNSSGKSQTFQDAGKIDAIIRERGQKIVVEHKTASDSVEPDSDYWLRLTMDTQVSKYYLATEIKGEPVTSVLYDVIHTPGQRPSKVPILDENGLKQFVDAEGNRATNKNGTPRQSPGEGLTLVSRPETPEEYRQRIYDDIQSRPHHYFARREVARTDAETLEYMQDAWSVSQQILYWRRESLWPRNPNACAGYGGCEFFALCAHRAEVDGIRYRAKIGPVHSELSPEVQNGKQLLTVSRMNALRKCPRYHYLKYENPTESCEPPSEALTFGALVHEGLELIFNNWKERKAANNE